MLIAAGVAALLVGAGVAVAVSMSGGSPETVAAKPDQASMQLAEAEKKRAAELEKKLAQEAESRRKLEVQVAETEAKRRAEEEARRKAAEEARLKAEAEAREKAEAENRRRIEDDTRKKVEAEFKARAEEEARKRQAEEEVKRKAEAEARRKADEEAKRIADAEAKRKADDEARKKAEQRAQPAQPQPSPPPGQVAAAPAAPDRATLQAQHGAALRQRAEEVLKAKGPHTDMQTGDVVSFLMLDGAEIVEASAAEVIVRATYQARSAGGFQRGALYVAQLRFRNQPPAFPLISAATPAASTSAPVQQGPVVQNQSAAAAVPDPIAYVAQHWPTMKPMIEAALKKRGSVTDSVSGVAMRFEELYGYRIVQVTAAQIVLAVTYRNTRAVPGAGAMTGSNQDITETAVFQNQPPNFPLVSLK